MKEKIKIKAIQLRKEGRSLLEIAKECDISKSTASIWLRDLKLSCKAKNILAAKGCDNWKKGLITQSIKRQKVLSVINKEVWGYLQQVDLFKNNSLLLCSLLYWCEGVKGGSVVNFVNSDPQMVSVFMKLFRSSFMVDEFKFRVCLHLHPYHNELTQKRFWSKIIGVPTSQFMKCYLKKNSGKNIKKGYPGCVSIRYYDYRAFRRLLSLCEQLGKLNRGVV